MVTERHKKQAQMRRIGSTHAVSTMDTKAEERPQRLNSAPRIPNNTIAAPLVAPTVPILTICSTPTL